MEKEQVGPSSLASSYVNSPDPKKSTMDWRGDRLLFFYHIPLSKQQTTCILEYEFFTYQGRRFEGRVLLPKSKGCGCIAWRGESFLEFGAILSYRGKLLCDGLCIADYQHPAWKEEVIID